MASFSSVIWENKLFRVHSNLSSFSLHDLQLIKVTLISITTDCCIIPRRNVYYSEIELLIFEDNT